MNDYKKQIKNLKKTKSDAELALKVFAEHLIDSMNKDVDFFEEKLYELKAKAEHGEATSLGNEDYETYRYWEGRRESTDMAIEGVYSFMRRLGYEEY